VAWLLDATRMLVEHLGGQSDTESWVEAVLAEALTSLPGKRRGELGGAGEAELERAWLEQRARWRDQSEERCEHNVAELLRFGGQRSGGSTQSESLPPCDLPELGSIVELDRWIASAAERLASADLRLATLAERLHGLECWRRLGFASEAQYARERLGMSASSLRAKRAPVRQLWPLPQVRRALKQGQLGFDAAGQLARVATAQTQAQWVERARWRTAKHLREEVELAEMAARQTGQRASLPPTEEQMRAYFELQQAVTSGRALVEAAAAQQRRAGGEAAPGASAGAAQATTMQRQMSAVAPAATGGRPAMRGGWLGYLHEVAATLRAHLGLGRDGSGHANALDELCRGLVDRRISGDKTAARGRVTWRLRVRESLARLWRSVEREAMRSIPRDMCFVEYACLMVWSSWWHVLDPNCAYAYIYARDRHRCCCPVCGRRDVTPHHVQYRSRGGGDWPQNVLAACTECHLSLIHGGAIEVWGPASRPHWTIGRRRGLVVEGRELVFG
jgi:hypothetical protein